MAACWSYETLPQGTLEALAEQAELVYDSVGLETLVNYHRTAGGKLNIHFGDKSVRAYKQTRDGLHS
jgi:hypothetical protein